MITLSEVGARISAEGGTPGRADFGVYLPGITFHEGYRLRAKVIHEADQFVRGIEPVAVWLSWIKGSEYDLWTGGLSLSGAADQQPGTHFGTPGRYLYRYELLREPGGIPGVAAVRFADPFGRDAGLGTLSSVTAPAPAPYAWTDGAHRPPSVDEMVVYELNVREFNQDFDGVVTQLDYLRGLGVNVLELMPVTNVGEDVEWGYTPLGYFCPDDRFGGSAGLKRLVDACHAKGMAVILDAVYAHSHPDFAYNTVYDSTGEPNPMMGPFAGEFFPHRPGSDFTKAFTAQYFTALNRYWLDEYHVDGFRYDYVPGYYDGNPAGPGYPALAYETYEYSRTLPRFQTASGASSIIQCSENLDDPIGMLSRTYTNTCWQNRLMDTARGMARGGYVSEDFAHLLDPAFVGYPDRYTNPASGETFPVAPFQYLETHDHERFLNEFGRALAPDLLEQPYGDRTRFYKTQPYAIALFTGKGIPFLFQGQEFGENWGLPEDGIGRNLFERPLHWDYFYDPPGRALVRLYRILGSLRNASRALRARGDFYYYSRPDHLSAKVLAFRRHAPADGAAPPEDFAVALNFGDAPATVWLPLQAAGDWREQIDGAMLLSPLHDGDEALVTIPPNYGLVFRRL